jgi:para-nitrobenzyl esterase
MDQVLLNTGSISGMKARQNDQEIYIFRGIPYAAPHVGGLRWKPAQPAASWLGVRECTEFSRQAAQFSVIHASKKLQALPLSEDCLYLNVMTPACRASDKLPVMVEFHGGGTRYGNGNLPISNSLGCPATVLCWLPSIAGWVYSVCSHTN